MTPVKGRYSLSRLSKMPLVHGKAYTSDGEEFPVTALVTPKGTPFGGWERVARVVQDFWRNRVAAAWGKNYGAHPAEVWEYDRSLEPPEVTSITLENGHTYSAKQRT